MDFFSISDGAADFPLQRYASSWRLCFLGAVGEVEMVIPLKVSQIPTHSVLIFSTASFNGSVAMRMWFENGGRSEVY